MTPAHDGPGPFRIAAIGGDGIGPEVVEATLPALTAAAALAGAQLDITRLDWGGDRMLRTGEAMPADGPDQIRDFDAILLGAVGHPQLAPDVSVWTLVLPLRKALDLYVNLRPIKAWPEVPTPFTDVVGTDFIVIRENTEGEYSGIGGRVHAGTPAEVATDVAVHSRRAIARVARYAFEVARERGAVLSLVTKSNVSRHGYALWDEVVAELGRNEYAEVALEKVYVDAMAARMIERPRSLGVLVCSNLFGDILSDAAAPIAGGLGMAPSANLSPGANVPGLFEPVHGSAPDIAGKGIANPMACILSGALLLTQIGLPSAGEALEAAVAEALRTEDGRTPDLGGLATTTSASRAVCDALMGVAIETR